MNLENKKEKRVEIHTLLSLLIQATTDKAIADQEYEQARDKFLLALDKGFPLE